MYRPSGMHAGAGQCRGAWFDVWSDDLFNVRFLSVSPAVISLNHLPVAI